MKGNSFQVRKSLGLNALACLRSGHRALRLAFIGNFVVPHLYTA